VKPRAVTGIGVCSPLGIGREAFVRAMRDPSLAPSRAPLASFDASRYPNATALEVPDFDPTKYLGDKGLRTLDRLTKLSVVAARLALHDAGLKRDNAWTSPAAEERTGIVYSNAYGSLEAISELDRVAVLEDARYINPAKFPNTVSNSAAGYVSIWEDLRALNVTVSDGNCGALDAVACADLFLESDRADALLVGGAEAMSEALFLAFEKLDTGEARLGEAAALFVVETVEHAAARSANVVAELVGYGTSFDAPPGEAPLLYASDAALGRAIEAALADAGIREVDLVVAGIAGVAMFDDAEINGIRGVLGTEVAIATPKLLVGETLGASAALGICAGAAWLGATPPASLVRGVVRAPVRTVLVTALGYYGNASAVVLRAPASAA
jgi:3-oxoacyl-[acyl-carrier-protein] synthase II